MAHGILLVLSDPVSAEADDAYNEWYDNVHLPEILALPGFTSARRFRVAEAQLASQGGPDAVRVKFPHRYVAVYEVEAPDVRKPRSRSAPHPPRSGCPTPWTRPA